MYRSYHREWKRCFDDAYNAYAMRIYNVFNVSTINRRRRKKQSKQIEQTHTSSWMLTCMIDRARASQQASKRSLLLYASNITHPPFLLLSLTIVVVKDFCLSHSPPFARCSICLCFYLNLSLSVSHRNFETNQNNAQYKNKQNNSERKKRQRKQSTGHSSEELFSVHGLFLLLYLYNLSCFQQMICSIHVRAKQAEKSIQKRRSKRIVKWNLSIVFLCAER